MPNLTLAAIVLAGVTVLSSTVIAGSSRTGPIYIGDRSANSEQETYGYVVRRAKVSSGLALSVQPATSVQLRATLRRTRSLTGRCLKIE